MKKIIISIFLFAIAPLGALAASFSDVSESHQYYASIESLKNLGIVNGHPDGTFKPEDPVVRAEALKMILKSADIESAETVEDSGFSDVASTEWFAIYTAKGKELGIVKGQGDTGRFTPVQQVNKSEFLKMLLQAFQIDLSKHQNVAEKLSIDTEVGAWYMPYISYAKSLGIIYPSLGNKLEPDKLLSRGECAEIIYKLLIIQKGGDAQKMLNLTESKLVDILVNLNSNNINKALQDANDAVFYSEKALEQAGDQGIVKAANKIAQGFLNLCLAYKAGLEGDNEALRQYVDEAKSLAGEAYADDASTQNLGKKIKLQGDILLAQIEGE